MDRKAFEKLVEQALDQLPAIFGERLENLAVAVQDYPTSEQLRQAGVEDDSLLLGLYQGVPLTERTSGYNLVAPDIIFIFQKPIEAISRTDDEIRAQVRETVQHEIAHYFGISDARLDELQAG